MKFLYRVNLKSRNGETGRLNFLIFECAAPSVEDLAAALRAGELVTGRKLRCQKIANRRFLITGREPYLLANGGFGSIEVPYADFVEVESVR